MLPGTCAEHGCKQDIDRMVIINRILLLDADDLCFTHRFQFFLNDLLKVNYSIGA